MTFHPELFEPLKIGGHTLKNRLVFGAHTANMSDGGLPGKRHFHYYRERARGGAAMIVIEPVPVHETAILTRGNFLCGDDRIIPGLRRIAQALHREKCLCLQQLYHVGHADAMNSWRENWSPSGQPSSHDSTGSRAMSEADIEEVIAGFCAAAWRAKKAGLDGVEIFAGYHGLIDQFWSPISNRRTDSWGGSFENNLRFSAEILRRLRKKCGNKFIIGLSVSFDPHSHPLMPDAETLTDIIRWHDEKRLMDYVTIGSGSYYRGTDIIPINFTPEKLNREICLRVKKVLKHAKLQAESQIRNAANAADLIREEACDMVSLVRPMIADPQLPRKAAIDPESIRPCISCNQQCRGRRNHDYYISCLVNPQTGHEFRREPKLNVSGWKILVAGAGVAGCEAALELHRQGARVTLAETSDRIGGNFRLAAAQPGRQWILEYLRFLEYSLEKAGVSVQFQTRVDAVTLQRTRPDLVIIATGSRPAGRAYQRSLAQHDRLPGLKEGECVSVAQALSADFPAEKKRVLLLDDLGNWQGIGTALHLVLKGHEVTLVTPATRAAADLAPLGLEKPLVSRFITAGGKIETATTVLNWNSGDAELLDQYTGKTRRAGFDLLVAAENGLSHDDVSSLCAGEGIPHSIIGDALAVRNAAMAIHEGQTLLKRPELLALARSPKRKKQRS